MFCIDAFHSVDTVTKEAEIGLHILIWIFNMSVGFRAMDFAAWELGNPDPCPHGQSYKKGPVARSVRSGS